MDLETIKIVITVARLKSFSAAALTVPCSQSSISRRVSSAEGELGVKIFNRSGFGGGKEVSLTGPGKDIVAAMVGVFDAYTQLYEVASRAEGEAISTIRLGMVANMMPPQGFAKMKSDLYDSNPRITLSVTLGSHYDLINMFRSRAVDAVLLSSIAPLQEDFILEENEDLMLLGSVPMSVGVAENSPLAKEKNVSLNSLINETFLLNTQESVQVPGVGIPCVKSLKRNFKNAGETFRYISIPNDMLEIRYEKAKQGLGIFPSFTPSDWRRVDGISYVSVSESSHLMYYYLLRAPGRSGDPLDSFKNFIVAHLK